MEKLTKADLPDIKYLIDRRLMELDIVEEIYLPDGVFDPEVEILKNLQSKIENSINEHLLDIPNLEILNEKFKQKLKIDRKLFLLTLEKKFILDDLTKNL